MDNNEYLARHGIKSQRWDVGHGPQYSVVRGTGGKPKVTNVVNSRLKGAIEKRREARAEKKVENADQRRSRLREEYDILHKKHISNAASVKGMLSLYKGG